MKIIALLTAASILISCNNATQKKSPNDSLFTDVDGAAKLSRIDLFCQRIEKRYKVDGINDIAFEKANEDFKK